ncbi:hypothetical protein BHM03_00058482, partial [Ensete ventricosum]
VVYVRVEERTPALSHSILYGQREALYLPILRQGPPPKQALKHRPPSSKILHRGEHREKTSWGPMTGGRNAR